MTYEELVKANESIKTTDIKGKNYAEVNQRVKAFRMLYPNGSIQTEIVNIQDGVCIMRAIVSADGQILATGTAYENEGSTFINKTSYIENCETSAVGRALGMLGIGIDTSIASYEEVTNAVNNQPKPSKKEEVKAIDQKIDSVKEDAQIRAKVLKYINDNVKDAEKIQKLCDMYKISSISEMNIQQCKHYMNVLKKNNISLEGEKNE